ncbi:NAD(P)/FAD-dependent oxidoreductase [Nonomuraea roseoviolacea subsp. roseoviolacea]|uniref:Thioredoxin reductase n=1 Tax=Nonomuraea roseoviolacea subsp. carminata TaxID=160689 RepID=A0ABT1JTH3_9ACTN|nr:FAD/NAD(P)-binding oxidoreductase [Nonomuraea roseoviolacea]MCP2345053.1 thioredoxin reductase [Nonomuraea roseoviolacea subsp. carminata]
MAQTHDVAVVGAGPAGLAAAVEAAEAGLQVALVDGAAQPGGQYWRHYDERHARPDDRAGHHGWPVFAGLRERLRAARAAGRIRYLPGRQVYLVTRDESGTFTLRTTPSGAGETPETTSASGAGESSKTFATSSASGGSAPDAAGEITARALILCTGGYDRQLPVPGWDLPGVMTAGGVQALLKGHRVLAGRRAVVAGTGPFLLPVATGLARAGASVEAVAEANGTLGWLRDPVGAASVPGKAVEAAQYAALMARHRIPYRTRTVVTRILGQDRVEAVRISRVDRDGRPAGPVKEIAADLVALGWGFTPSLELALMLGADTRKDVDGSLVVAVDGFQRSSVEGVYVAGEATGVGGAVLATQEGRLSALALARSLGRPAVPGLMGRLRAAIGRGRRFAAAMHRTYPVPGAWTEWLEERTLVCRCEEVSYGDLRRAHDELGAHDPRTLKMLARPGMGWCQGRVCGFATAGIAACLNRRETTAEDLRPLSSRSLAAPVTLGELAALDRSHLSPDQ